MGLLQHLPVLVKMRRTEKIGRIVRRMTMIIAYAACGTFVAAGAREGYDRRTISRWCGRFAGCLKSGEGIRAALSDRPRTGRPTKIDRKLMEEARMWCEGRAFTPAELSDRLYELSGKRLDIGHVRRIAAGWGHSGKKTSPKKVRSATMQQVYGWRHRLFSRLEKYRRLGYSVATMDESHFKDSVLSFKYWSKKGMRIFMHWSGGHHRFSMLCTLTEDGRAFFNHCQSADTTSFMAHIDSVYRQVGRMVLVLDKASWHMSDDAKEFFSKRDIILIWYPTGHPYLNPTEEVWGVLKRAADYSIRYADLKTHLTAVYNFIDTHKFDYDFAKFWRRRPPKGVMRLLVRTESELAPSIQERQVASNPKKAKK